MSEELVIRQAAPTLAGIKTGSLFPCPCEDKAALLTEMNAMETQEAKIYKALDKMEAVIQHNEADIATWLPLEYDLNIAYGADEVAWNGYLRRLKEAANEISRQKIAEARRQAPDDAGK